MERALVPVLEKLSTLQDEKRDKCETLLEELQQRKSSEPLACGGYSFSVQMCSRIAPLNKKTLPNYLEQWNRERGTDKRIPVQDLCAFVEHKRKVLAKPPKPRLRIKRNKSD